MREIKFRAWDKSKQVMICDHDLAEAIYNRCIICQRRKDKLCSAACSFAQVEKGCDQFELMQYTELHDSKNREIYEGDIVKEYLNPPRMHSIYEIKFNGGSFHLSNPSDKYVPLFAYDTTTINYLEVIGNIYENPRMVPKPMIPQEAR